jgi:hypothetical protein
LADQLVAGDRTIDESAEAFGVCSSTMDTILTEDFGVLAVGAGQVTRRVPDSSSSVIMPQRAFTGGS